MANARGPEEIIADLGVLEAPADLDPTAALLAELALTLAEQDDLTRAKHREAARRALENKKLYRPAELIDAAFASLSAGASGAREGGLDLSAPEPWPEAVEGSALLDQIAAAVRRYVVLTPPTVLAVALWAVHAHAFEASWFTPRLAITSPTKRCGKSLLLEILEFVVPKPLNVANVTAAAVFRGIEKYLPTLLIDEADTFLVDKDELGGILNSGHRRNGQVLRTVGEKHEPKAFSTFAPVAIAMIGRLKDTLDDRSIPIRMRRKRPDERVERFRPDRAGHLEELGRKATRWALDHWDALKTADPEIPAALHDREQDNWRPLLAIADAAGADWPDLARRAAVALSTSAAPDSQEGGGALLLADLREIFNAEGAPALFTEDLLARLRKREDRPWGEWRNDKPLTFRQMAALLKPFEIRPAQIRIGRESSKGYKREAFEDAFSRYLPPLDPKHPKQVNGHNDLRGISIRNTEGRVSDRGEPKSPVTTGVVSDVSDREGETDAEGVSAVASDGDARPSTDEVKV